MTILKPETSTMMFLLLGMLEYDEESGDISG
jgi:hypothetical protein